MNRRQKIIVSITGIFIVLLILVGLTYAYFLTRINGNTNTKSISATTANLALTYGDGNGIIGAEKIRPGTTIGTKIFTVENTGDATTSYGVFLEDVVNQLVRTNDLQIEMTCTSSVTNKECDGYNNAMPHQNDILVSNDIDEGEIQTYSLTLNYIEAGVDQSDDMNKEVSAKVQIYDLNNTVDLQGIITDYNPGDYVVVHSTPKESQIRSDGSYKVVGLEPGNHTVEVYNSSDTQKYNKTLTITKGETDNISGTTVTVTDTTRTVMTSVSNSSLNIRKIVNSITLTSSNGATINKRSTTTLTATISPTDAEDSTITWTTSNPSVATISSATTNIINGTSTITVTGVNGGTATIIATSSYGAKKTYNITVEVPLITFKIGGTQYQAKEGMTWEEWVDSEYNLDNDYYVLNNLISRKSHLGYVCSHNGNYDTVVKNEQLIENGIYSFETSG